jgi:hypothetical protein
VNIIEKMQEFNKLIERKNKGEEYLNGSATVEEKAKHIEAFIELIGKIDALEYEIRELGYNITKGDILHGIGNS